MADLVLDPAKTYAELERGRNIVARVFPGETIPEWAAQGRKIIEVPAGVAVAVGDRYQPPGAFDRPPLARPALSGARERERDLDRLERLVKALPAGEQEIYALILKLLRER